ncbi:MAG TPA: nucleotidyltransferase family protein [Terriglobales bacterium]|nr:nucleotidyltransferase family protein [Terriglobales bacterium]
MAWPRLMERAEEEGVLPLLYWNLKEMPEDLPADALARLKGRYLANLARTLRVAKEVGPLLGAVRAAGRTAVLTKGLRMAQTVYPDLGLRPFWDVDLVVQAADWPDVRGMLEAAGFVEATEGEPGRGLPISAPGWTYSPYFLRGDLALEIHFNVFGLHFPAGPLPPDVLGRMPLPAGGGEATVLSPAFEFCYLCLHAQQHSYRRLIWLTDIALMAAGGGIPWDEAARVAAAYGLRAPVFLGLALAERLWPGTVAPNVLARFRPGPATRAALGLLWPGTAAAERTLTPWPYYMPSLFSLWERRSAVLAARSLPSILFPPRAWLAGASGLPKGSARLTRQYGRRLLRPFGLAVRRLRGAR